MPFGDSDEWVSIDYDERVTETADAVLYRVDGEKLWLPKSVSEDDDDPKETVVWVKEWFAIKEGLI